jgi:hypothetical protein
MRGGFLLFLAFAALIVAVIMCGPSLATIGTGQLVKQSARAYTEDVIAQAEEDMGSEGYIKMSASEFQAFMRDRDYHDEVMAGYIVQASASADASQTAISLGGFISLAVGIVGAVGVVGAFMYLIFGKGKREY